MTGGTIKLARAFEPIHATTQLQFVPGVPHPHATRHALCAHSIALVLGVLDVRRSTPPKPFHTPLLISLYRNLEHLEHSAQHRFHGHFLCARFAPNLEHLAQNVFREYLCVCAINGGGG